MRRFKMIVSMVTIMSVLLIGATSVIQAEEYQSKPDEQEDVTAEKILADVFFLRPIGILATAFGAATFLITLPFTLPTNTHEIVGKKLVGAPWNYTFKRPVGHVK